MAIVIGILNGNELVYCQSANHGRGDWAKLKNARRKHNKGEEACEHCKARRPCNRSPRKLKKK